MLKELLEFVVNEKREVRLQALQGLAQFSAKTDNESPKVDDAALLAASLASVYVATNESDEDILSLSLTCMINFSASDENVLKILACNSDVVQKLVSHLTTRVKNVTKSKELASMLLSNLSILDDCCTILSGEADCKVEEIPQRFKKLFVLSFAVVELDHVCAVLQNCARHASVGEFLVLGDTPKLNKVLSSLGVGSVLRRRALSHLVRNVCLKEELHATLLSGTDTLNAVQQRLFGSASNNVESKSTVVVETDLETQRALLDVLLSLTHTDLGRQRLFDAKIVQQLQQRYENNTEIDQPIADTCNLIIDEMEKPRFKTI